MNTVTNLGEAIVALRTDHGWSQEALAAAAGVSARTIQRLEEGQPGAIETVAAVARAFGLDVATLQYCRDLISTVKRMDLVPAIRNAPDLLAAARQAEATALHIESHDQALRDAAYGLVAALRDWKDLGLDADLLPDAERNLTELLQELEAVGGRLFCYRRAWPSGFEKQSRKPIMWDTLFCVVYPSTFPGIVVGHDGRELLCAQRQPEDSEPLAMP